MMDGDRSLEERKKRALEGLGRRLAREEAEHHLQQQKRKKRLHEEKDNITHVVSNPSADAPLTSSLNLTSKKGNISFSCHKSKEEASDPAYFQLSHRVHENLLKDGSEITDKLSVVNHLLHDLVQHGDSADKYIQGSRSIKINNLRILLDNYVQNNGMFAAAQSRALQTHSRRSKRHMSLKQHKKCGSFHLPQELHNFELFKPMHEMWKSYIGQLLKHVGKNQLAQCLFNADLHGSIILVVQCKINTFHGVQGIMIRETTETFGILTEDNKFRVVPKKFSVFMLQADCWKITIHGDNFTKNRTLVPGSGYS